SNFIFVAADVRRLKYHTLPTCQKRLWIPSPFDLQSIAAMNQPTLNRPFYLPRLPREYYQGDAVVHWTLAISHREHGWLPEPFHGAFRELMLHAAAREGLFCPAYCL